MGAGARPGDPDTAATDKEKAEAELVALQHERAGYVLRGLQDRVAQVDEQIKLRGGKPQESKGKG
jgi:hypothetical protein